MEQNKSKKEEKSNFWSEIFSVITAIFSIFGNFIYGNKKLLIFGAIVILIIGALFVRNVKGILVIILTFMVCIGAMIIEEYKFESKEEKTYDQAIEYVNQRKYQIAIIEFRKLSYDFIENHEISTQIRDTERLYKEEILNEVNLLIERNNYAKSIQILQEASEFLNNDTEIEMKIDNIRELEVKNEAQTLFDEQKYEESIIYIKMKIEDGINSVAIDELLKQAEERYYACIIEQVDKYIDDGKFTEAKDLLNSSTNILGENKQIYIKLEEINEKEPRLLSSFEKGGLGQRVNLEEIYDYQDVYENVYNGISYAGDIFTLMDPFSYGNSFFINSKYKFLRGTLTILNKCKKGKITFYNGDNKIGEYTIEITKDKPYEIEINLENVNLLGVEMAGAVLANAKLYVE